jgi:hypothetical protein
MRQLSEANAAAFDPGTTYGNPAPAARPAPAYPVGEHDWNSAPYTPGSPAPATSTRGLIDYSLVPQGYTVRLNAGLGASSTPSQAAAMDAELPATFYGGDGVGIVFGGSGSGVTAQDPEGGTRFIRNIGTFAVNSGKGVVQGTVGMVGDVFRGWGMGSSLLVYGAGERLGLFSAGTTERSFNYWRDLNPRPFAYDPGLGEVAGFVGEVASPGAWMKAGSLLYRVEQLLANAARTFGPQVENALSLVPGANLRYSLVEDSGSFASTTGKSLPSNIGGTGANYNAATGQGIYVLCDEAGAIRYFGRGDAWARLDAHANSVGKADLVGGQILWENNLTKAQAKGLEQALMDRFGGAVSQNPNTPLLNRIRSYSPTNPNATVYKNAVTDDLWKTTLQRLGTPN